MSLPAITVAIPTCNGARHLAEALRSVVAQEGVDVQFIISDDRSDDDTLNVARAEVGDRARIEVNGERLGLAGNWNRCVALSQTPLVAVFHQDDRMRPDHLAAHVEAFGRAEGDAIGMVASAAGVIDAKGKPVPSSVVEPGGLGPLDDPIFAPGDLLRELAFSNPLRCSGVTLRASALIDVGGFDPSYRYAVDWDAWLRIAARYAVAWVAEVTVDIRWHPASETHRFKGGTADLDEIHRLLDRVHGPDASPLPGRRTIRKRADRRMARAWLNRAYDLGRAGQTQLARTCLRRAIGLDPGVLAVIAADPRLAARMLGVLVSRGSSLVGGGRAGS